MTRKFRSRLRAAVLALAMLAPVTASFAQSTSSNGVITQTFSLTRVGQGPIIPLSGQSSCSIVIDNQGSGLTLVPRSTSAANPTPSSQWVTATTVNSGSISGAGTYVGNIAGTGLTGFSFYITALSSGTVSGSISCSPATSPAGGGGVTGNVNVVNTPGVNIIASTPIPVTTPPPPSASTATRSSVAATITTTTCLASNAARRGAIVQNNSTATMFLIFGSGGGVSDYTYSIPSQSNWENPLWNYTGIIGCVWSAANGNAYVTEVTP